MKFRSKIDASKLNRLLRSIPKEMTALRDKVAKQEAKGFVQDVIAITPPFHAGLGGLSAVAKRKAGLAGAEQGIERDLNRVFQAVKLKGKRREEHPDVRGVYEARNARRKGGKPLSRGRKQAYYVDERKLAALAKELKAKIGKLMSGWAAAAREFRVALPAFAKRHGTTRGAVNVAAGKRGIRITISNKVSYAIAQQLDRLANAALNRRAGSLERRLPYLLKGELKRLRRASR